MNRGVIKNEDFATAFPEESKLIVEKILEKYGFAQQQEKDIEKFFNTENPTERVEIFENLPGVKISSLVKEYAVGKISLSQIPSQIAKSLNVSEEKAKQIAQDLEKSLLSLITPLQKKLIKTPGEILLGEKPTK
jgi:hypothetical protein